MGSLRQAIVATEFNNFPVSLKNIINGIDSVPLLSEIIEELVNLSFQDDFSPMNIITDGVGMFRFDRFRIYFRHPFWFQGNGINTREAMSTFLSWYPGIFNGRADVMGYVENLAEVSVYDKLYKDKKTFRFVADVFGPDLHSDFVGIESQGLNHLVFRTLFRHFHLEEDTLASFLLGAIVGDDDAAAVIDHVMGPNSFNRRHFLAGLRSWFILPAVDARGPFFAENHQISAANQGILDPSIYVMETATVNRVSDAIFQLGEILLPGTDLDDNPIDIWTIQLSNYVKFAGWNRVEVNPNAFPRFNNMRNGVTFGTSSYATIEEAISHDWIKDLFMLHPELRVPELPTLPF